VYPDSMRRLSLRNTQRLDGYGRTDLRVTWSTLRHWEIYGELLNVFKERNFVQPVVIPSSVTGGSPSTTEHYAAKWYECVPSFGLRVRF